MKTKIVIRDENKFVLKISLLILSLIFSSISFLNAQELRKIDNKAFQRGEELKYRVYYESLLTGKLTAGELEMKIEKDVRQIAGRNTMHIVADGRTRGAFNFFFKVRDRYETFLDEEAIVPWLFIRRVNEGGYIINQDVVFNNYNNTTQFKDLKRNKTNTSPIPPYTQDILSAIYYARTFDVSNAKIGDSYPISFTLDDTVFVTKIIYEGKENIKTSIGTFECYKIKPMVLVGNVFKDPYPMMLWVTADENKIPVFAQSTILVGSVNMELISYKGARNRVTSKLPSK